MTFLEYTKWSYALAGVVLVPGVAVAAGLGIAAYIIRGRVKDLGDLIKTSAALVLVFYLCRAWVAETNVVLLLPLILILVSTEKLKSPFPRRGLGPAVDIQLFQHLPLPTFISQPARINERVAKIGGEFRGCPLRPADPGRDRLAGCGMVDGDHLPEKRANETGNNSRRDTGVINPWDLTFRSSRDFP